ncbi:MAG: zinc-binding dehydrogenase [Chloroflexi bacterium]|nr:zinc-binding dehydrogenase [Chloroflexota bacterium]
MKAAFVVAPRKFEIKDIAMPTINENEMLVKIDACGVCTSDMASYLDSLSEETKKRRPFPRRVGHEPSGTVVEVGKNVKSFKPGDRITGIFGMGSFAEYVAFDPVVTAPGGRPPMFAKIPDGIPAEHALGEPLMDLMSIARCANPEIGDYVFQVGCGFMGLGVIAGVASSKLREYIVCDLEDWRLKLAKELGATITLNPRTVDVVAEVMKITNGKGVDVAIEAVGHPPGLKLAGAVIKSGRGKIIVVGWHQAPDTYELVDWIKSPVIYSPQGIGMSTDPSSELPRALWALQKGIYPMSKLVTHKYQLEEIDRAFQDNLGRTPGYIKGVVMP